MFRCAWAVLISLSLASPLWAQLDKYNPYAAVVDEPAIAEDGTINWPTFYKSASLEARFQSYFKMGSCVGTKQSINDMLKENKVDVNTLPSTSFTGKAVKLLPGVVGVVDAAGRTAMVAVHPQGVSRISVSGNVSPAVIGKGLALRFTGSVDQRGRGAGVVDSLEIVTLGKQLSATSVEPDRVQTIVGVVTRRKGNLLHVAVGEGKLKSLSFMISPEAKTIVNGSQLELISLGDDVVAKGHVFAGQKKAEPDTIFASDLLVTKPAFTAAQ